MRGMLLRLQLAALLAVALFAPNHVEGDAAARMSGLNFQPSKLPSKQLLPPALSGKGKPSASSGRAGQHPAVPAKHRKYFKFLRARAAGLQKREPGERPSSAHLRPEAAGLNRRPAFSGDAPVNSDNKLMEHLRVHPPLRLARPAQTLLHQLGLERSASSGRIRPRKDGTWSLLTWAGARCRDSPLVPVGLSVAESVGRACLELVCAQNRFLTLGTRIGRELLLTVRDELAERCSQTPDCSCEPGTCAHPGAQHPDMADGAQKKAAAAALVRRLLWACKEAVLLTWLENARGISAACAPEPLKLRAKNAGRAVIGRAMRLWGEELARRIIHGPGRARSRFSLGRLSRITTVLAGACTGAGIGAASAGAMGASAPDAAWAATAGAAFCAAGTVSSMSRFGKDSSDGRKGLVLSAADANALLLGASFLGFGMVGGRYTMSKTGVVHLNGCLCQGLDEDVFRNPHPSLIFGRTHEDDMSLAHILACMPFSLVDCLLGCMGYMPSSGRVAMLDPAVQASALRGGVVSLQGHSLGSIEGRLLKANMGWRGTMMLLSPPPPFGWEEGTVRTCGRFDPICSGPLMSVAKHLRAPVNYVLRDISHQSAGFVHERPYYTRHLAGADAG